MDPFWLIKGTKTLLIDDDPIMQDALKVLFNLKGCYLSVSKSAEEAIRLLEGENYNYIISDFHLPGMSGLEFFEQMPTCHGSSYRILISGHVDDQLCCSAMEKGVDLVIEKPFSVENLLGAMADHQSRQIESGQYQTG